jgi:hypothetical protein
MDRAAGALAFLHQSLGPCRAWATCWSPSSTPFRPAAASGWARSPSWKTSPVGWTSRPRVQGRGGLAGPRFLGLPRFRRRQASTVPRVASARPVGEKKKGKNDFPGIFCLTNASGGAKLLLSTLPAGSCWRRSTPSAPRWFRTAAGRVLDDLPAAQLTNPSRSQPEKPGPRTIVRGVAA